ncbi:MAG: hypothetical protein ACNS60_05720 [Candidatus Cyclobacteriaceae bacterium M2_1C_046]
MSKAVNLFAIIISVLGYILLAFFIERHEHYYLLPVYSVVFIAYLWLLKDIRSFRIRHIFFLGVLFRLIFFISLPELSDDFYRFIWDGRLMAEGFNPYQYLPSYFTGENALPFLDADIYYRLNSPDYFTVYPPVPQFIFLTAAALTPDSVYGSVLVMKFIALLAEFGLFYVLFRLLRRLHLPLRFLSIYAFNPLVIIEVVGNLHHEGIMLFFLMLGIYLCIKKKYLSSALIWALSVATKLLPLMFLPLLIKRLELKKLVVFSITFLVTLVILFIPLIDGIVQGMGESISLYYQKFEFNASIYYVVREIGFWIKGYNIIQTAGPYLGFIVFLLVMAYSLWADKEVNWFKAMTWIFVIFLFFATTVHPWYIISLICFSVFTGYLFPIVWSYFIFLTYAGYTPTAYVEQTWVLILEYTCVITVLIYEVVKKENQFLHNTLNVNPAV